MLQRTKLMVAACRIKSTNDDFEIKHNQENVSKNGDECNPKLTRVFKRETTEVLGPMVANETGTSRYLNYDIDEETLYSILPAKTIPDDMNADFSSTKKTYYELQNVELPLELGSQNRKSIAEPNEEVVVGNNSPEAEPFSSDDSIQDPDYEQESEDEKSVGNAKLEKKQLTKKNRKLLKNSGKAYTTKNGKKVDEWQSRPLKINCRRKCSTKVNDENRVKLFNNYWELGDYDKRVIYMSSLITVQKKKSVVLNSSSTKKRNRQKTLAYFVDLKHERVQVCQVCFRSIFGETSKFIRSIAMKKELSDSGIPHLDKRGKHEPPHKISKERKEMVLNHIRKFPAYESHYSRRHTEKKYLSADLTKAKMYSLYYEEYSNPVSLKIYSQLIDSLNLKFKKPHNDTCRTCDELKMKIECSKEEAIKRSFENDLEKHHAEAENAYASKKSDKALTQENPHLKVFDLQQVLPTPYLTTGTVFYKRQLHTYNLTVHDCSTNESSHFMWHEAVAGRGANEIASCLYKYFSTLDSSVEHVVCYSDTCGGQNKNSFVCSMFTYLVSIDPRLKIVDHKFLVPGHTHMECDSDNAVIEKFKKKSPFPIHVPRDWLNLVRMAGKSSRPKSKNEINQGRFKVVEMTSKDFFQFSQLLKGPLILKKITDDKEKLVWKSQKWIRYEKQFGLIQFKQSLFKTVNFRRKNFNQSVLDINLTSLATSERPIDGKKKKNLLELLELIDEGARDFYIHLKVASDPLNDTDPNIDRELSDVEC